MTCKASLLVIFGTFLSSALSYSEPRRCDVIGRGSMCADYLIGYYECDGSDSYGRFRPCNPDEMCSCGLQRKCPNDKSNPCMARPTIPKLPGNFIVSFHGDMKVHTPHKNIEETLHGVVLQDISDVNNKKLKKKTIFLKNGKLQKTVTKITIKPLGSPYYKQYTIIEDGSTHCQKKTIYRFKDLFHDLRLLAYKTHNNVFEYREGPLHVGDRSDVQTWTFASLHHTQFAPKHYVRNETGNQHSRTNKMLKIQYRYFHEHKPHGLFFRIPAVCTQVSDEEKQRGVAGDEVKTKFASLKDFEKEEEKRDIEEEDLDELLKGF